MHWLNRYKLQNLKGNKRKKKIKILLLWILEKCIREMYRTPITDLKEEKNDYLVYATSNSPFTVFSYLVFENEES